MVAGWLTVGDTDVLCQENDETYNEYIEVLKQKLNDRYASHLATTKTSLVDFEYVYILILDSWIKFNIAHYFTLSLVYGIDADTPQMFHHMMLVLVWSFVLLFVPSTVICVFLRWIDDLQIADYFEDSIDMIFWVNVEVDDEAIEIITPNPEPFLYTSSRAIIGVRYPVCYVSQTVSVPETDIKFNRRLGPYESEGDRTSGLEKYQTAYHHIVSVTMTVTEDDPEPIYEINTSYNELMIDPGHFARVT